MLDRIFGYKVHSFLQVLGMCVLAFGLPLNKVLMSIGAIWGVSNLILEADFQSYYSNIKKNKVFLWLLAFCLLHIIGLFWTSDFAYALHDIKIKLPLLAVPLALAARPITDRIHIHYILYALLISLLLTTLINFGYYNHWFGDKQYVDARQMSLFGSHIRIGILISLGAGLCLYFISSNYSPFNKVIWYVLFTWFSVYTFYSQILSGAVSLLMVVLVFVIFYANKYRQVVSFTVFGLLLVSFYLLYIFLKPIEVEKVNVSALPKTTKLGNPYTNDFSNKTIENNKQAFISVCDVELKSEWEKRSSIPYDGFDKNGQVIRATIIRYLSSKNLSKDAVGMQKLTVKDIQNIEHGIASVELLKTGIIARLYGIKYQMHNNSDPNGHSILQRIEYWKTGSEIIKNNWLVGVGTGDVQMAFDEQYKKDKSILKPENRLRAHNTYITVWLTFGVLGIIIFLGFVISYFQFNIRNRELFPLMFMAVAIVTFFIEDTLETQLGVSLFSLFVGLYLNPITQKRAM